MKHIQFVRCPGWSFSWPSDASYYGRRWGFEFGPWLVLVWQMTDAELGAEEPKP